MSLEPGSHIYFMGIGGTGMASVAGLCQQAGYKITGSDKGVYPPMSDMLADLKIPVATPYAKDNVANANADLVVVANALSRGNDEVEYMLENKLSHTSFPKLLGDLFLSQKQAIVVTGTHGKTTTTSIIAHVLKEHGENPSYLIGGIPKGFTSSFNITERPLFAIEGDEYDTAFFDKGPKFLHYHPKFLIFNNLEFDHADIYENLEAIEAQFHKLLRLVPNPRNIIANVDDDGVLQVLKQLHMEDQVTRVATLGTNPNAHIHANNIRYEDPWWRAEVKTETHGEIALKTSLSGKHNIANCTQVLALLERLKAENLLSEDPNPEHITSFGGVARRADHLGQANGIDVFEDFAHHPSSVSLVIDSFRARFPKRRLVIAFEPANATSRRKVFCDRFAAALTKADQVFIGACPDDKRIPADEKMDTNILSSKIGPHANNFDANDELLAALVTQAQSGDVIVFMSPSSFSGIQHKLLKNLS